MEHRTTRHAQVESWRNRVNPVVNRVFDVLWEGLPELDSDEAPSAVREKISGHICQIPFSQPPTTARSLLQEVRQKLPHHPCIMLCLYTIRGRLTNMWPQWGWSSQQDGASAEGALVMSVDRIGLMRPTKLCKATADGQTWEERPGLANWRKCR